SIAEDARDAGMKVGIVSDVPVDHATPAAFYAKQPNRNQYYEIASQVGGSGFDFFAAEPCIGNGKANGRPLPAALAADAGYTCVEDRDGLSLAVGVGPVLWQVPIGFAIDADDEAIRLIDLVDTGIELLTDEQGFFMMIEGGRIDWSGHANDLATNVRGTLDLDAVVERVLAFQAVHPDDCLVVVTADHETGGLQTRFDTGVDPGGFAAAIDAQQGSYEAFNRSLKDWLEEGAQPGELHQRAIAFYGLAELDEEEHELLASAVGKYAESSNRRYGKRNAIAGACQQILDARCGVAWTTGGHTAVDVPTTAIGPGAERFDGHTENSDIALILRELITAPESTP
ncbi:MAG: alkaline phosphatase, partial [Planctomycetota bacterium]